MSGLTPTPPPDADGTVPRRGLLNSIAQAIQGVKTFLAAVVMSAGLTLNGAVNQMMKVVPPSTVSGQNFDNPVIWYQLTALNQTNFLQWGTGLTSTTWELCIGYYGGAGAPYIGSRAGPILIGLAAGTSLSPISPGNSDLGATGNYWRRFYSSEGLWIVGAITDFSGTPGAATINAAKGRAALANAASSVTITNSLVTVNSVVLIEWEDDPGQRHRVVPAAGSFTVTLSAAAAANVKFRFFLVG